MGRWMQIMTDRTLDYRAHSNASELLAERDPYPVLSLASALPSTASEQFPQVHFVADHANYTDESLWLAPDATVDLSDEFALLVDVADFADFSPAVAGAHLREHWDSWPQDVHGFRDMLAEASRRRRWMHFLL